MDIGRNIVLRGTRTENLCLYKVNIRPVFPKEQVEFNYLEGKELLQLYNEFCTKVQNSLPRFERWGHHDKRHVKNLLMKEKNIKLTQEAEVCEPYIYGKAHRLPFGLREKHSKPVHLKCVNLLVNLFRRRDTCVVIDNYAKFRYGF